MGLIAKNLQHKILNNLSLVINDGELVVITGPSGAGKTTLLKCIAGFEPINKGEILLSGRALHQLPPYRRNIAMLFQNPLLYPHLNVENNLGFPLKRMGITRKQIKKEIVRIADIFNISKLLTRFPNSLSGGEAQRIALARVLLRTPALLLLDEPLTYLDIPNQYLLRRQIKEVQQQLQIPMIYVTHDQNEAMAMGERVGIMHHGRLLQIDTPQVIYQQPNSLQVAKLIGIPPINTIAGEIKSGYFISEGLPSLKCETQKQGQVTLAMRPEHIKFDSDGFAAQIERHEFAGAENICYLRCGPHKICCRVPHTISIPSTQTINITMDLDHALYF